MITRYRWYKVHIPGGIEALEEDLFNHPFDAGSESGFLHLEKLENNSKFRFFSRSKLVVTKVDDTGNTTYEEVSTIRFTDFVLITSGEGTFFRIENPGLNLRTLLNSIELHTGLGFTCRPITFHFKGFDDLFRDTDAKKLVGLKVVEAVVEKDVVAQMKFSSKQGIIAKKIRALNGIKYTIESAVYEIIYQSISGRVSYTAKGIVRVGGQLAPLIIHLIEHNLKSFIKK